jgi:hypothetical protein
VVEGLARRSHSNRSAGGDAGAKSSKVEIPWKIRWDGKHKSPLLLTKRGLFIFQERGGGKDGYGKRHG